MFVLVTFVGHRQQNVYSEKKRKFLNLIFFVIVPERLLGMLDFPYQPIQLAAKDRGFDISKLRARQIKIADFNEFDLLVVMDQENRSNLQNLCPEQSDKVHLLTDYSLEDLEYDYVPDPYYTRNYNQTLDIIEASLNGLVESVRNHNNK